MKTISYVFALIICTITLISTTSVSAKTSKKSVVNKSSLKMTTATVWKITCDGTTPECYTIGCGGGIEIVEPGGPMKRVQVGLANGGPGAYLSSNIFLHTETSNHDVGLGYYPAVVQHYSTAHQAFLTVSESTVEYTDYSTWKSALP